MVKVFPPRGGFSRCADTAFAGFAVVEKEKHERHERRLRDDADERVTTEFFGAQARFVQDANTLQHQLKRYLERMEMEAFVRKMERQSRANDRAEAMRLFDDELEKAVANRRHV